MIFSHFNVHCMYHCHQIIITVIVLSYSDGSWSTVPIPVGINDVCCNYSINVWIKVVQEYKNQVKTWEQPIWKANVFLYPSSSVILSIDVIRCCRYRKSVIERCMDPKLGNVDFLVFHGIKDADAIISPILSNVSANMRPLSFSTLATAYSLLSLVSASAATVVLSSLHLQRLI